MNKTIGQAVTHPIATAIIIGFTLDGIADIIRAAKGMERTPSFKIDIKGRPKSEK